MTIIRTPSPSIFRPKRRVDQGILREHKALIETINRRNVLRGALSLGALSMLTGCDVTETDQVQSVLRAVSAWNDRVQEFIFRAHHLARTYTEADVVKPPRFNAHYDVEDVKPVDGASWKLELSGLIADKRPWTAAQIYGLPEQEMIIKHICVEGWDYIGQWSGVNLRQFLERVGADLTAKYVAVPLRRRLYGKPRYADRAASADDACDQICAGANHRSVRIPATASHHDQAGVQERQMGDRDRSDQRFPRDLLE